MGDHEQCPVIFSGDRAKQFENLATCVGVEGSCWLVGEQDGRGTCDRSCNGDALPLPHGQLSRARVQSVPKPHAMQDFLSLVGGVATLTSPKAQADRDIFDRGEWSQKVERLEDHATVRAAVAIEAR